MLLKAFVALFFLVAAQGFANYAYVVNSGDSTVSVIDTNTNAVINTIILPGDSNSQYVAFTPNGSYAYVTSYSTNSVSVINTETSTFSIITSDSFRGPLGVIFTPDGNFAYVGNNGTNTVSVIDVNTSTVTTTITVGTWPVGMAITPNGRYIYVANNYDDTVSVIDTSNNLVIATISVGSAPFGAAVTPNGEFVYVSNINSNNVNVIQTSTNNVTADINVQSSPRYLSITPDGQQVYVPNQNSQNISVINTQTNIVTSTLSIPDDAAEPFGSTTTNSSIYVTDIALNFTYVINRTSGLIAETLLVGNAPQGLAITPTPPPLSLTGLQKKNQFLSQTDIINIIYWENPNINNSPVSYLIYRDSLSNLIGEVAANAPLRYDDHNRKKDTQYIYYVISVSADGSLSSTATITLQ